MQVISKKMIPGVFITIILIACLSGISTSAENPENNSNASPKNHYKKKANVYLTTQNTNDRITQKEPLSFENLVQPEENKPTIILDKDKTFQTLVGIGGALTDASAETFYKLPADKQQEILTAFFDKEKGNGFSLCRTTIHSSDFSSSSYTYD